MQKTIIGIVVATLVLYIWGFLFWGVNPIPYESWKQSPNDEAAQLALKEHFPESGTYFIPGIKHDAETTEALYDKGPTGFVHINHASSSPTDPLIMIQGFVLDLIIVCLLAGLFKIANAREFRDFARLSLAAGAVAVVMIDGGHIIWWREPAGWVLWQALYNFTAWIIAGHILGIFMKEPSAQKEPSA